MAKTLMVGFSTAQNIVNVLPAVQMQVDAFMFIETEFAESKNWSDGSINVLRKRGIEIIDTFFVGNKDNANIISITSELVSDLEDFETIIFNLGGGQKVHSIALWECMAARAGKYTNDKACYSDPTTKKIVLIQLSNGAVLNNEIAIDTNLTAAEIFEIFGFEVTDPGSLFFNKINPDSENEIVDYTKYADFRKYVSQSFKTSEDIKDISYTLAEIKGLFGVDKSELLKNKIKASITSLKIDLNSITINKKQYEEQFFQCVLKTIRDQILVLNTAFGTEFEFKDQELIQLFEIHNPFCNSFILYKTLGSTFGVYFERLLIQRVISILQAGNHCIVTAISNLKINRGNDNAEYDIVLVTNQGTLIVLDAKTDDFTKKDEDARNFNLLASAGQYAKFIPVYLFYPEDLNETHLSQSIKMKLKDSSYNRKSYLTFNSELDNFKIPIDDKMIDLNPVNKIIEILKLD